MERKIIRRIIEASKCKHIYSFYSETTMSKRNLTFLLYFAKNRMTYGTIFVYSISKSKEYLMCLVYACENHKVVNQILLTQYCMLCKVYYIPWIMLMVCAVSCFVWFVTSWFYPYVIGLTHWHWGAGMIAPKHSHNYTMISTKMKQITNFCALLHFGDVIIISVNIGYIRVICVYIGYMYLCFQHVHICRINWAVSLPHCNTIFTAERISIAHSFMDGVWTEHGYKELWLSTRWN